MSSPKILITGGTGFAGSHLVEYLLRHSEAQIHVTSQSGQGGVVADWLPSDQVHQLDLTDGAQTAALIQQLQPTQLYHLAATATVGNSFSQAQATIDNHTHLQLNVLEAVRQFQPTCRILTIGSALEYDSTPVAPHLVIDENYPLGPVSPYALSKTFQTLMSQAYVRTHRLDIVLARPFNHIGERQATGFVVSDFAAQIVRIEHGEQAEIKVGNLAAERDFTDVKDMVKAYFLLMEKGQTGEIYNIGSGRAYSIQVILNWLREAAQVPIPVSVAPEKFRPLDIHSIIADNDKVCTLGWQPTADIKPTVERVLAWWRQQPHLPPEKKGV